MPKPKPILPGIETRPDGKKLFNISFHKTGTKSVRLAVKQLGFHLGHAPHGFRAAKTEEPGLPKHADIFEALCAMAQLYDGLEDTPMPFFANDLAQAFPEAKFVLNFRKTEDWFRSVQNFYPDKCNALQRFQYGVPNFSQNASRVKQIYEKINENNIKALLPTGRLLVFRDGQAMNWQGFIEFLGADRILPDSNQDLADFDVSTLPEFPHIHKTKRS